MLKNNALEFMNSLPIVGIGKSLSEDNLFTGPESVFYNYYLDILGPERVKEILALHGYERTALFRLHIESIKIKCIPKAELFSLANGNKDIVGFAYQYPTECDSWRIPGRHFKLEFFAGKAIKYSPGPATQH